MFKSKFSFAFILMLAGLFLFSITSPAQTLDIEKNDNAVMVSFDADVDSLTTVTSDWFSIPDYLSHSLYTYPVSYTKIQSSVLGKPHITVTIERSNDQTNVIVADTIGNVGDSLETLYSGTANLNNGKSWYYRLKYVGTGTGAFANKSDATLKTDLVFIRPKN